MRMSQWMCLLLVATALAWSASVAAQDCNVKVFDPGNRLSQGAASVHEAMKNLDTLGADTRVIVTGSVADAGGGESFLAAIKRRCSSWQSSDGDFRNNMLLVLVAVEDHETSIIYGAEYLRALDGRANDIRTDRMNPRFRDGDIAGGIANGLEAMASNIRLARTVLPSGSGPVTVNVEAPSKPIDLTGLWWVFGGLVILLSLVGLLVAIREVMRSRERRKTAQESAKTEKAKCAKEVLATGEPVAVCKARIGMLAKKVSEADLDVIMKKVGIVELFQDQAVRTNSALDQSASNPEVNGRSPQDYDRITSEYKAVYARFQEVHALLVSINTACDDIERRADGTDARLKAVEEKVGSSKKAVDAFVADGFKAELVTAKYDIAVSCLGTAKTLVREKRINATEEACNEAEVACTQTQVVIDDFRKSKATIEAGIVSSMARIDAVIAEIALAKPVFDAIAEEHPESAWSSIAGNGTEAEKRIEAAKECLDDARDASTMENQEWGDATACVAQAVKYIDQASSLMRSIHALKANLEVAKNDSSKEIEAAQADIETARVYIKKYDADIRDSLMDELSAAATTLAEARTLLHQIKPDYLRVLGIAKEVNAKADCVLANATGEHDEAERIRRRDVSARRDAIASCSRAAEYIEDHSSDVGDSARQSLATANGNLSVASGIADQRLVERIERHDLAKTLADQAYERAQDDFRQREASREAERARQRRQREAQAAEERRTAQAAAARSRNRHSDSSRSGSLGGWGSSSSRSGGSSGGFGSSRHGSTSGGFGSSRSGSSSGKW